jgi:protein-L-isoaspartate(D-aspartate) O-methyltransferase
MSERPSFPIKLNTKRSNAPAKTPSVKPSPGKAAPLMTAPSQPQGLDLDSSAVRQNMVQKLAAQGLKDPMVLQAMGAVERHRFVESALVTQAYEDTSLPIG